MDTHKVDGMCAHTSKDVLQLKDGVIKVVYEMLCKKLGKIIERLEKLVEL